MNVLIPNKCYEAVQHLLQQSGPQLPAIREDKLLYIISVLYNDSLGNEKAVNSKYNGAPLYSKILRELLSIKYNLHVSFLVDNEIIVQTRSYKAGSHSKCYIIHPNLIDYPRWHTIMHPTFKKRLKKYYSAKRKRAARKYPYIVKWFAGLVMDHNEARKYIDDEYVKAKKLAQTYKFQNEKEIVKDPERQHDHANRIIKLFEEREFHFTVDGTGYRLHSLLTRCSKGLRNFITYNDEKLVSIDLKNSQPYLLLLLMNSEFLKTELFQHIRYGTGINYEYICSIMLSLSSEIEASKEFQRFKYLVANGTFYDFFINQLQVEGEYEIAKKATKRRLLITFYSKKGTKSGGAKTQFNSLFPLVYKFINCAKDVRHQNLAILLQRIESYLILDRICKRLASERPKMPIFTIHDSIVTTVGNEDFVKTVMQDELLYWVGVQPNVSIEYWAKRNSIECTQQDGQIAA
jgi:hypothetical protein